MALNDSPELIRALREADRLSVELAKVRRQRDSAATHSQQLEAEIENLNRALGVVAATEDAHLQPPSWMRKPANRKNRGSIVAMLSDTHFDEVVNPTEMDGLNSYNRKIATMRLEAWTQNTLHLATNYLSGVTYDGMVLILGGDIFSGDIHEELAETNEDTMLGSLLYWSEQVAASINLFADTMKNVHVVSVPGNHGRMTRKPRAKLRAKTNFDWLLSKMVERHFRGDKRVTFNIPDSADATFELYGYRHLVTHGDQAKGGGGIGGIWPTVMRLRARKLQRYADTGQPFRTIWMGHWHQYISTPEMVVNGSMKGYDEYAMMNSFQFQVPQQALAVVTPEHNITWQCPVFCMDRKKEKW